jgi:hypothetical protein
MWNCVAHFDLAIVTRAGAILVAGGFCYGRLLDES